MDKASNESDSARSDFSVSKHSVFRTTRWDLIRKAQGENEDEVYEGMERLAKTYWYPLYAFACRNGVKRPDAQDLTQGFLARFVSGNYLASVKPEKGRFRSYLLVCFKNYLADERERNQAQKRGGGIEFVPLDVSGADDRFTSESLPLSSEEYYDRDWAQSLMISVLERMRAEAKRTSKGHRFTLLQPFLIEDPTEPEQQGLRESLELGESGLRSAIQRLRARFADYLWTEIASTVEDTAQVKDETRHVLGILSAVDHRPE